VGGKPFVIEAGSVNLGIAVDVERSDGSRSLMVPCIKGADKFDFKGFHGYYEELITKTRENQLTADDFQGTNISLTNPGGLGTIASVPRLMSGQGTIVAAGSLAYPVEWAHASAERVKQLGVSKVMTLTSTYDHRVIQGAESGSFLGRIEEFLQGEDNFYESVATELGLEASVVTTVHPASASAPPLSAPTPAAPGAAGGARLVQISTDYVFDGTAPQPYAEDAGPAPRSAYGRTKLAGEEATAAANKRHFVVRSSWLFGIAGSNFVETMLQLAADHGEVLVVRDQVGSPTYTWHLASGIVRLIEGTTYGIHHMAAAGACSWYDFAREIFDQAKVECNVLSGTTDMLARPAPRPAYSALDTQRESPILLPSWRDGLAGYLAQRQTEREAA